LSKRRWFFYWRRSLHRKRAWGIKLTKKFYGYKSSLFYWRNPTGIYCWRIF